MDFIKVTLKGEDFTFTALDFEQLQTLESDFEVLKTLGTDGSMPNAEQRKSIIAICTASASTKHPSMTVEQMARLLTLGNIAGALKAVAGVTGLETGDASGNA